MKKTPPVMRVAYAVLLSLPLWLGNPSAAQTPDFERVFHHPKPEVEKAIQELHAMVSGRLPILDSFVGAADQPLEHYGHGYYESRIQVTSARQDDTVVRVTARITAWYTDPNSAQSGYRVLPSNGRLETDLLDRIEEVLASKTPGSAPPAQIAQQDMSRQVRAPTPPASPATAVRPNIANAPANDKSAVVRRALNAPSPGLSVPQAEAAMTVPSREEDLELLKQRREDTEKRIQELNSDVHNLEEILHNQAHPADIAVVRKSGTHVMAKPRADAPVLFSADAGDEFQILDNGSPWVHVQVSGPSRGWIRRSELDLPQGLDNNSKKIGVSDPTDHPPFRVVREETNTFSGDWEPLHGKTVRIIWAEPELTSGKPSSTQAKRDLARSLFITTYEEISLHDQMVTGVVIVFDSADGGQIAATLENLKQWHAGSLSDASFWRLCSIDPPELFQDSAKGGV